MQRWARMSYVICPRCIEQKQYSELIRGVLHNICMQEARTDPEWRELAVEMLDKDPAFTEALRERQAQDRSKTQQSAAERNRERKKKRKAERKAKRRNRK